ncbi:MAG: acetyl-CoA carboxylase biotin carboxyl carrier protein [Erysipelotrichia bacterium]|nr:acetyl-CoA carboxylase biotin carboxyl carrier protein [Erysipelotrichia bacterium]
MDTNKVKQIMELFEESKVSSMELEIDDIKIKLAKQECGMNTLAQPQVLMPMSNEVLEKVETKEETTQEQAKEVIQSPLVGTFYSAPAQGAQPFVKVGSKVNKGDVICIIEAMKVMNEIKAQKAGTIVAIKVNDGDMVQFDEVLMELGDAHDH